MKRIPAILCVLLVLLLLFASCTRQPAPKETTDRGDLTESNSGAATDGGGTADLSSLKGQGKVGTVLPDFSLQTADGGVFKLSEALRDRELVLINLWATWCEPCKREFPYLQEAYTALQDRIAVLALSVEETDTAEVLQNFSRENELSFLLGRDEGYAVSQAFNVIDIPTSILVDRESTVVWMKTGYMNSAQEYLDLFNTYLKGGEPGGEEAVYTVTVLDQNGTPVPDCELYFCTEESCVKVTTDEDGKAVYTAEPYAYRVQLLSIPDGFDYTGSDMIFARAEGDEIPITVTRLN